MPDHRGSKALLVPLMLPSHQIGGEGAGNNSTHGLIWMLHRSGRPSVRLRLLVLAIMLPVVLIAGALLLVLLLTAPL
jgi:hypothetical protein